jgi:uncharacterized repeat protein (TIGR03803 family)
MKKNYNLVFALCCAVLCVGVATAQERIMFSKSYDEALTNGLYYINKDGTGLTKATQPNEELGAWPEYFIVSKDGELVGIHSSGGVMNEEGEGGYGTLYRVTANGVVKVQDFNYAEASQTFLTEGWNDGKLYGVGPQPISDQTLTGTKYSGLVGKEIKKYGFRLGELLAANNGHIYGTAPIGGTNSQGYIYRFDATSPAAIVAVYSFAKATGHYPQGQLMQGQDGYLYGVTKRGGRYDYGVIYKVKTDGTGYQTLHHFDKSGGMYPDRGLVQDASGNLYGMTYAGGTHNLGVVYKIRPDGGGFVRLHSFSVKQQFDSPIDQSLLVDSDGFLYGLAPQSQSIIFRIKNDGTLFKIIYNDEVYIHTLRLVSSMTPQYKLAIPGNGSSGVPTSGTFNIDVVLGANQYILEVSPTADFSQLFINAHSQNHEIAYFGLAPSTKYYARVKTTLWSTPGPVTSFTTAGPNTAATSIVTTPANGSTNVSAPTLKVTVKAVTGATRYTVQLSTQSDFTGTVLTQTSSVDNQRTLTLTGLKYNTKYYARVGTNINAAFGPSTSFTTRAEVFSTVFSPQDESTDVEINCPYILAYPIPGAKTYTMQLSTTSGFTSGVRTWTSLEDLHNSFMICDLKPSTTYYARVRTDVSTGWGQVTTFTTRAKKGGLRIVGINTQGGSHNLGTIFSFSVDSMKAMKHHDNTDQNMAFSDVVRGQHGFYGTQYDHDTKAGSVFRYSFTEGYQVSEPISIHRETDLMMASSGMLYVTPDYSPFGNGAIYKLPENIDLYSRVHFFNQETGRYPRAPLYEYGDGYLYGTTMTGGTNDLGTIFRMKGNGKNYEVIHHFTEEGYRGYSSAGGVVSGGDGYLYGTTYYGHYGSVYKIKPDGSGFTYLHTFTFYDGAWPMGELIVENGLIYGVTNAGGVAQSYGVIYRIGTDGSGFTILKNFNEYNGGYPTAGLASDGNGMLYGFLPYGGEASYGTLYRIRKDGSGYETLLEIDDPSFGFYPVTKPLLIEDEFPPVAGAVAKSMAVDAYPNPTTSAFTLRAENKDQEVAFELMDFTGTVVYRNVLRGEDLKVGEDLPRGMYVLKIRNGESTSDQMLIKK